MSTIGQKFKKTLHLADKNKTKEHDSDFHSKDNRGSNRIASPNFKIFSKAVRKKSR